MHEYEQVMALRDSTGRSGVAYDAAELVRAAWALLRDDPVLLAGFRRRLDVVYVDELADTDPAQVDLLELVAGQGAPLVAFADPDSSTFAFRGADAGVVASFADRFRDPAAAPAARVTLGVSYRAGPVLLAATGRVAARLRGPRPHRVVLAAPSAVPGEVEVHTFRSATSEAAYVAHRLREAHLREDRPWSAMAVVVRSTTLALATLQRALAQAGVPVTTLAEDIALHLQPGVQPLLLCLSCALEPDRLDEEAAVALLHSPLGGADPLAERRLRQGLRALALAAGDRRPSGVLLVEALREPAELAGVERTWARPAQAVARLLRLVQQAAAQPASTAETTLWALWEASGLARRWSDASAAGGHRGAAADRDLDAVMVLFEAAARFADRMPGAGTEVFLDHLSGQALPADTLAATADRGSAVRILTAHAAKGLQWDLVIVAGVQEGIWPDLRLRGSVLGSEALVDVLAGRSRGVGTAAGTAGQVAALLEEERRLFYVAATRARQHLIVTAVHSGDGEEQPSRFLSELAGGDAATRDPVATRLPRALTLPALVAELRLAVTDASAPLPRRRAAATGLARLARAGVTGADPEQWWGLRELSDDRPLVDAGTPVTVSPSIVEGVQRCSLRWLLERHGGAGTRSPEQSVGDLVHELAVHADGPGAREELLAYLDAEFGKIELSARWLAGRERRRAEEMVDKLVRWLAANPRRLAAIERDFAVHIDEAVQVRGRVDRLEVDDDGRLVVIDLKTGKAAPPERELAEHPQLGAYQAAIEAGAFPELGTEAGGAALVQLGTEHRDAKEQDQPPLASATDPDWAAAMVRRTAATMAASTFRAVVNSKCRSCPVRTSCPVSGKGRHVTEPGTGGAVPGAGGTEPGSGGTST